MNFVEIWTKNGVVRPTRRQRQRGDPVGRSDREGGTGHEGTRFQGQLGVLLRGRNAARERVLGWVHSCLGRNHRVVVARDR